MKVTFFGCKLWEEEYLRTKLAHAGIAIDAIFTKELLHKEQLPEVRDIDMACVFVDSHIDGVVIAALPNLKYIVTRSTGYDHIDLAATAARGITVTSVPSYGEHTVAEQAFALLLAVSRKLYRAADQIRETGSFSFDDLQGFDLKDKTMGVVGTGRIGRHSVRIAQGFGMNVVAYDPQPNAQLEQELKIRYLPFEELLRVSDVVTIHVPYLPQTHHLFNEAAFAKMKKGAVIINTARGQVVDTQALVMALSSGQLGGAGLDVLEEEGVVKDELGFIARGNAGEHDLKTILANHVLFDMPNVVITPHNAFNTREALTRILDTTVEDIASCVAGKPINVVRA